ncbi:MAG: c-type cytochrome [Pseudomonadota bacterium]
MSKFLELTAIACLAAMPAFAEGFGLGRPATSDEIAAWDIDIRPDGAGLPRGRGTVTDGEELFAEQCAACHGDFGEGVDRWPALAGGFGTLDSEDPVKTVGSYWPYLSTVWDYVHRAMPFGDAQSLSDDDVYAITAYILYVNDIVDDEGFELSHENFGDIRLPNEDNFLLDDRAEAELAALSAEPCMEDCKNAAEITMRARILDVTPDEEVGDIEAAEIADVTATAPAGPDPELVAAGEKVFRKCKACHQLGDAAKNRTGPILNGIVGAAAGRIEDFRYSNALKAMAEEGLVWDEASLIAFLAKPRDFMKGTKMSFNGLKDEAELEAIIAYLATFE